MGVTGPDNFESDRAADYLACHVVAPLVEQIRGVLHNPESAEADDPDCDAIVAAVEILTVLCRHLPACPPATELVTCCRDTFLERWDASIDELGPAPGHKEARRAVILATFDRLIAVCREEDRSTGPRDLD